MKCDSVEVVSTSLDIAELIRLRKREGFDLLYRQYAHIIYGMSIRLVQDVSIAEDIVQETFVKTWKNIDQFTPQKASFSTWVLNIARYTTIDYLRSKQYKQRQKNQTLDNFEYPEKRTPATSNTDGIGLKNMVARME